jgi:SAM-dependent methyltransferase
MEVRSAISYKDPAGYVFQKDNIYYRTVSYPYKDRYDHLMNSGLYAELTEKKILISHEERPADNDACYRILLPEQLQFFSYPYEWTYTQWVEMASCLLQINLTALRYGMIMKDATPYNFVFFDNRCILIDSLSFEFYQEGQPWVAYKQFCETVLAPLALIRYVSPECASFYAMHLNGLPLQLVSRMLPVRSIFNASCLLHIHFHQLFSSTPARHPHTQNRRYFTPAQLNALLSTLYSQVISWKKRSIKKSNWSAYYQQDIESESYLQDKEIIIRSWLNTIRPETTIDLGCNTGMFTRVAAEYSGHSIGIENDSQSVDLAYRNSLHMANINYAVANIAEPTPGVGWDNKERTPLIMRLNGDMLMALALVHHLHISGNVPLPFIANLFSRISTKYLIIEFIPKDDQKVQLLLSNREDIFSEYNETGFKKAFKDFFDIVEETGLKGSLRKLYLLRKL